MSDGLDRQVNPKMLNIIVYFYFFMFRRNTDELIQYLAMYAVVQFIATHTYLYKCTYI